MCGGGGSQGPSKKEKREERERQQRQIDDQNARVDAQLAQQRKDADEAARVQAEQFRITTEDNERRYQDGLTLSNERYAQSQRDLQSQRDDQERQLAAQLKAQREAEERARLEAEKARNRGRSVEAAEAGTVQKNKQMKKSKKKARLGTKQLANPLTNLGINNLGIGTKPAGSGNGLNIAQIKKY
jgi:hypothetical protein